MLSILLEYGSLAVALLYPSESSYSHKTSPGVSIRIFHNTFSYSCDFFSHCYGTNTWLGNAGGAFTVVDVVNLTSGDGGVDNEMWLVDNNLDGSKQCMVNPGGSNFKCWVEAGYVHENGQSEHWFWSDIRPQGGGCGGSCYYHEHDSPALNGNDYGNVADITITENGIANQWSVDISGTATQYSGVSTNNAMAPNRIDIGQELYGTQCEKNKKL